MLFDARKLSVLWLVIVQAASLEWAPESPALHSVVYACVNGTISLPWAVSMTSNSEYIVNIEWYFRGQSEELIAMYTHYHFHPLPSFSGGRAEFLSNAGLTIHDVTAGNKGHYSVDINGVDLSGSFVQLTRDVTVEIDDHLPTTDGHLHVQEASLTQYDVTTDQNHLVLTCGEFTHQPSFQVEWQTPSGDVFNSSAYKDGHFQLLVPNPVTGGQYTCRTPANTPCVQTREEATVDVDECASQNKVLQAENARLKFLFSTSLPGKHVMFAARLTANATQTLNHSLVYSDVIINEGGAYDPSTGNFTVPQEGIYHRSIIASLKDSVYIPHGQYLYIDINFENSYFGGCTTFFTGTPARATCSDISHYMAGQRLGIDLKEQQSDVLFDLNQLNLTDCYYVMYDVSPCLTDDFLIFGANVPASHYPFTGATITDAMVFMDRFHSYNSSTESLTMPFDGVFYFHSGNRGYGN